MLGWLKCFLGLHDFTYIGIDTDDYMVFVCSRCGLAHAYDSQGDFDFENEPEEVEE